MADAIDELFDCFEEGETDNNEENEIKTDGDQEINNRYVKKILTYKTR